MKNIEISLQVTNSMVNLLLFCLRVTKSRLKTKIFSLRVTTSMGAFLFSLFRVTNVKLINKKKFHKYYSFKMAWAASFYCVFSYLACFVVSRYKIFIWVRRVLMAYASLTTCLFTRLQKTLVALSQRRNDHMQVYIIIMYGK